VASSVFPEAQEQNNDTVYCHPNNTYSMHVTALVFTTFKSSTNINRYFISCISNVTASIKQSSVSAQHEPQQLTNVTQTTV